MLARKDKMAVNINLALAFSSVLLAVFVLSHIILRFHCENVRDFRSKSSIVMKFYTLVF